MICRSGSLQTGCRQGGDGLFSPNERLHFVFANKNDTYYCFETLALDLERFLWLLLRRQGYAHVYFIDHVEDAITIGAYGSEQSPKIVPEKRNLFRVFKNAKARSDGLCNWMLKQLSAKDQDRCAIVFPLKDFCSYFSSEDRKGFLTRFVTQERRTGILILTAPVEAEGSMRFLLNSPVFEYLGEQSILDLRTAKPCDLYSMMYRSLQERMQFFNVFTSERIHCILTRIFMEEPGRISELSLREDMESFLLQWMNNPALRAVSKNRQERLPSSDVLYRDLSEWLKRNENWNLLAAKAMQISKAGGIRNYLDELGCEQIRDPVNVVGIRRSADSYAGKCLRLRLKTATSAEPGERGKISELLDSIQRKVLSPRNREDNTRIRDMTELFLSELPAADDSGDASTVRRLLYSVNFCVDWIAVDQDSSEEEAILTVIEQLRNYIVCSTLHFSHRRNLEQARRDTGMSGNIKMTAAAMRNLELQEEIAGRMLGTYEDAVQASIVKLAVAPPSTFTALAKSLSEEILKKRQETERELNEDPLPVNEQASVQRQEPQQEEQTQPEDEEYVLTDSDFDINPFFR